MKLFKALSTKWLLADVCQQIEQAGIDLMQSDFIVTWPVKSEALFNRINTLADQKPNAVFTSSNAVNAVSAIIDSAPGWNIFCMSGQTQDSLLEHFSDSDIVATADNAAALAHTIIANKATQVVFFCGDQRREELPTMLREAGIAVEEQVVYTTVESPQQLNEHFDAVLFFSPSAVKSFFSVNSLGEGVACFSIGETTAREIRKHTNNKVIVAEKPTQGAIAATLINYHKNMVQS